MGSENTVSLEITVGEQSFRIRVPAGEEKRWRQVEARANQAVNQVLGAGVVGGPKALAMATFQLAAESEELRENAGHSENGRERLAELIRRIDEATGVAR